VIVTHGYEAVMVRWLAAQGLQAGAFRTEYGDEQAGEPAVGQGSAEVGIDAAAAPAAGAREGPDAPLRRAVPAP